MKICPNCKSEIPNDYNICWNCNFDLINNKIVIIEDEKIEKIRKKINCLRCDILMEYKGSFKFHEGFQWGVFGDLGHLFTNNSKFELYKCPECNKIEFFAP